MRNIIIWWAFDHPENLLIAMFMFDETDIRRYIRENQEQKLVAGIIFIDNFEEAMSSTEEVRRSLLAALIERKITKYMQSYDAIITKVEKDRYIFVVNHKHMSAIQSSRFSILDEVREINIGNEMSVTMCIGVGMNAISYGQSFDGPRMPLIWPLDEAAIRPLSKPETRFLTMVERRNRSRREPVSKPV